LAIVDLDKGTSRQPQRGDRALIVGLGGAILVFAAAIWLSAPHPRTTATTFPQSSAVAASSAISRSSSALAPATLPNAVRTVDPALRQLVLPANLDNVDLFLVPERITNENLIWTLRSVVRIRGGVGIASVEGPSIVTWTEKGFQYWMISPTRTTDELIKIADDLR
jgi:hypothetical protein